MSFDIIFVTSPPAYPLVHEMQVVQPQYSAEDLENPIATGEKQNLSISTIQSQINPVYQLQLNSEILSEDNLLNPGTSIKLKKLSKNLVRKIIIIFIEKENLSSITIPNYFKEKVE